MQSTASLAISIRALLTHAIEEGVRIELVLRNDGAPHANRRSIEGRPIGFFMGRDGVERVRVEITSGDTEQIVPLRRIARIALAE